MYAGLEPERETFKTKSEKYMKIKNIINYLIYYQRWRRGANIEQPNPTDIGEAIDGAIRELRNFQRLKRKWKIRDYEEDN